MILGSTISPNHLQILGDAVSCLHLRKHATLLMKQGNTGLGFSELDAEFILKYAAPAMHFQNIHGKAGALHLGKNSWKSSQMISTLLNYPGGRTSTLWKFTAVGSQFSIFKAETKLGIFPLLITKYLQYIPQPIVRGHTMAEKPVLLDLTIPSPGAFQTLASPFHMPFLLLQCFLPVFLNGSYLPRFLRLNLNDTFCLCWVTPCLCDW